MPVTFHSPAAGDVTMLRAHALHLLALMGCSGRIPSALGPQDIPAARERLRQAIDAGAAPPPVDEARRPAGDEEEEEEERPVGLAQRAWPLLQLLEAAERADEHVTWDERR